MTWFNPITWSSGQIVTAAQFNEQIKENLTHLLENSIAWLGTASSPYTPPTPTKAISLNRTMTGTANTANRLITASINTSFRVWILDTLNAAYYDFFVPSLADGHYVIAPRWRMCATSPFTACELKMVVTSGSLEFRIKQRINNAGLGTRTVRVFILMSAAPVTVHSDSTFSDTTTEQIFTLTPPGRQISAVNTVGGTSWLFYPAVERGETFEIWGFYHATAATVLNLLINGTSSGFQRQALVADGTTVSASRAANQDIAASFAGEGVGFFYAGGLDMNGRAILTGFHTLNPLSPQIVMKSIASNTSTFTRMDTVTLSLGSGTVSEVRFVFVRNCLR